MDYSKFQVEDFVTDSFFIKWVKSPTEEEIAFWSAFLSKNPECSSRVEEARQIILLLDIKEDILPEGKFIQLWEGISRSEQSVIPRILMPERPTLHRPRVSWLYKVAATIFIFVAFGATYYYYNHRTITFTTAYGESRALFLPDSTKITLNSNSQIQYKPVNFSNGQREVTLKGEAFFAVVHDAYDRNFLVHTDELHVEVLGTKFNVNSRRGTTRVVLQEGKVKLDLKATDETPLVMQPGELVEFTEGNETTVKKNVDADNYSAWKNNRLIFSRTSLKEIAQLLEDNYGYRVIFQNAEIAERNFTGTSSSENLQELFEKLSVLFELKIKQEENTLIIEYKREKPKQLSPT
jgi:transmembrane sensor